MNEFSESWQRAMVFLRQHGHVVTQNEGNTFIVDQKAYAIGDLIDLAFRSHPEDWLASEDAFLDVLLDQNVRPGSRHNYAVTPLPDGIRIALSCGLCRKPARFDTIRKFAGGEHRVRACEIHAREFASKYRVPFTPTQDPTPEAHGI